MSASDLLNVLFNAGVAVSIIATVLSLGMSFTLAQVLAPLRRWVLVTVMILALAPSVGAKRAVGCRS